jgi:hypothetical protein
MKALLSLACLFAFAPMAIAQTPAPTPKMILPNAIEPARLANETALACAGHIRYQPFGETPEIVGAEEEQEQRTYSDGDIVYLNAGSSNGIKEGQTFQIIRPRGDVKGVHRQKTGFLGTYVQDIGQLQVFKVREGTSAAKITFTCDAALLGDLIVEVPVRESPLQRPETNLDRFADPSGKQVGRLMMARDNREMLTSNHVVYIDLGGEDNVKRGDYLTIFRPLGTGNLTRIDNEEMARNRATGFLSDRYRGGGMSNQASRAKDSTAFVDANGRYRYKPITSREVKRHRPLMPRKIVGEMVIIDVQSRTATAIITRVAAEVHTGDWVEIQ